MTDPQVLISRYFTGTFSSQDIAELSEWILSDPANALEYARASFVHNALYQTLSGDGRLQDLHDLHGADDLEHQGANETIFGLRFRDSETDFDGARLPSISDFPPSGGRDDAVEQPAAPKIVRRTKTGRRSFPRRMVAAILLPLLLGIAAWGLFHSKAPSATLAASVDARWDAASAQPAPGMRLATGTLDLDDGLAQVRFPSGAEIIVQGPARFRINSDNGVDLDAGRLTAVVPLNAHGFAVHTPSANAVDLGTEFGVAVSDDHSTRIEVFRGKVETRPLHPADAARAMQILNAGQASEIAQDGAVVAADSNQASQFVRQEEFNARVAATTGSRYQRWLAYSYQIRRDPDIVAYYTFDNAAEASQRLLNRSYLGSALDGIFGAGISSADAGVSPANDGSASANAPAPSINGHAIIDNPSWTTGRWPQKGALAFDPQVHSRVALHSGPDDPLDFSAGAATAKPFTIAAWICPANFGSIISKGPALAEQYAIDIDPSGHLRAWIREPESDPDHPVAVIGKSLTLDGQRWVHLAMTYEPSARSVRLYVDGTLVGEAIAHSDNLVQTLEPIRIGARLRTISAQDASKIHSPFLGDLDSSTFRGRIDELSIFRRAISADQVKEMYEAGRPD